MSFQKGAVGRLAAASTLAFGLLTAAQPAAADTTSANLAVSANVTKTCRVSTTPVAFGPVNVVLNTAVDATGSISVTCTAGTAWEAIGGEGQGVGAVDTDRNMTSSSSAVLKYNLYTDSNHQNVWLADVNGPGTIYTFTDVGSGSAQVHTVYARIPAGQTATPAGGYADTVLVTLYY